MVNLIEKFLYTNTILQHVLDESPSSFLEDGDTTQGFERPGGWKSFRNKERIVCTCCRFSIGHLHSICFKIIQEYPSSNRLARKTTFSLVGNLHSADSTTIAHLYILRASADLHAFAGRIEKM